MKCPFEVFNAGSESFLCFGRLTLNARDVVSIDMSSKSIEIETRSDDNNSGSIYTVSRITKEDSNDDQSG